MDVTLPSEPIHVQADATRLSQVFINILNNACKYTEPWLAASASRSSASMVTPWSRSRTQALAFHPTSSMKFFELFSQVDRTLERSQGGLGIGLGLAKRLVEMHQGSIQAFSNGPGTGSRFVVRLPVIAQPQQRQVPAQLRQRRLVESS
jgi:signal transduction histidine kinase